MTPCSGNEQYREVNAAIDADLARLRRETYACPTCKDMRFVICRDTNLLKPCPKCGRSIVVSNIASRYPMPAEAEGKVVSNFSRLAGTQEAVKAALSFVRQPFGWLTLHGNYGAGKTHLTYAVANGLRAKGLVVAYFPTAGRLLDTLRATYGDDSYKAARMADDGIVFQTIDQVIRDLVELSDVLIVEEITEAKYTEWASEKMFGILEERYKSPETKFCLFTANDLGRLRQAFAERGDALLSRIHDGRFACVRIEARDARPNLKRPSLRDPRTREVIE